MDVKSKFTCLVYDGGVVKIDIEGEHLPKREFLRVLKGFQVEYKRRIIQYRQQIRADASEMRALREKEEAKNISEDIGVDKDAGNKTTEPESRRLEPTERPESTSEPDNVNSGTSSTGRGEKEKSRSRSDEKRRREEAIRRATAKAGIASRG